MKHMKQLFLFKICDAFQLAHLYEHLYYAHIDTLFRNKGYYQPIDYSIDASTYADGVVTIAIELYNSKIPDDFLQSLQSVRLDITGERLDIAINQLIAEKQVEYQWVEYQELKKLLSNIDKQPWQDADDFELQDLSQRQVEEKGMIETNHKLERANTFSIELRLISDNRGLVPLYRQIAGSIINTLAIDISDSYAYFITSHRFEMNEHGALVARFNTGYSEVEPKAIQDLYEETMRDMESDKVLHRQLIALQNISYLKPVSYIQPDPTNTFEDTDILIGSKGWKKISTSKNLESILQNLELVISLEDKI